MDLSEVLQEAEGAIEDGHYADGIIDQLDEMGDMEDRTQKIYPINVDDLYEFLWFCINNTEIIRLKMLNRTLLHITYSDTPNDFQD